MKLTNEQITNLIEHGWDDSIGDINNYSLDERTFMIDTNIEWALMAAKIDNNLPRIFESIMQLHRVLKTKNLRCSVPSFRKRIIFTLKGNNKTGFQNDLSISPITPDELHPCMDGEVIIDTGLFDRKLHKLASYFFEPGFLDMDREKKISLAGIKRFKSPEVREKHRESQNRPEVRKKLSQAGLKRFESSEAREKNREAQNRPEVKEKKSQSLKETFFEKKKLAMFQMTGNELQR